MHAFDDNSDVTAGQRRSQGASRAVPPSTVIHLNNYINIGIYSTKNINFTDFLLKYHDFG
jgi:hypothetical protein